jgi:mannose-1-phosphate guanylyltransferase
MLTDHGTIGASSPDPTMLPAEFARGRENTEQARGSAHVLILAGGEGLRMRSLTRALAGDERPKQFCAFVGREPMLAQTARRAALLAPSDRVLMVLTRRHEAWYGEFVEACDPSSLVIQPENRGTATAVLYGLLRIVSRSPHAPVVVLPSDHWVSNESAFMLHAQAAVGIVEAHKNVVVLLGVSATRPETEYGWIEPGEPVLGAGLGLSRVSGFVEKPAPELAEQLHRGAALWNTSVVVGQAEQLLLLFAMARPLLVDSFLEAWPVLGTPAERGAVERIYAGLPAADLSRDVLAAQHGSLSVLAVRGTAWEDLGHFRGLIEARRHLSAPPAPRRVRAPSPEGRRRGYM